MKNSCASRELSVGELARRAGVAVSALHFGRERTGWTPRAASTTARQRSAVVLAVGDGRAVLQVVRRDRQGA
ncbi:hypothetical protein IPC1225_17260 [Pseudomonas aeruginosa]|nr:hypothetical protein IPC1225_17260 [Pseudomonas aeruginosa]